MASAHWPIGCWRQVYDETTRDVDLSYNLGVRVSQVKPSNCFRLHPTSNTQQSRFLTACRRLEKLLLPSIFWHKSFVLDDVKVLNERKWHFRGQNILWPLLYIFRGSRPPYPRDLRHPGNKPTQTQTQTKKHTDTDRQTDRHWLTHDHEAERGTAVRANSRLCSTCKPKQTNRQTMTSVLSHTTIVNVQLILVYSTTCTRYSHQSTAGSTVPIPSVYGICLRPNRETAGKEICNGLMGFGQEYIRTLSSYIFYNLWQFMIYIINYNNRLLDLLSPYVFSEVKIVKKICGGRNGTGKER